MDLLRQLIKSREALHLCPPFSSLSVPLCPLLLPSHRGFIPYIKAPPLTFITRKREEGEEKKGVGGLHAKHVPEGKVAPPRALAPLIFGELHCCGPGRARLVPVGLRSGSRASSAPPGSAWFGSAGNSHIDAHNAKRERGGLRGAGLRLLLSAPSSSVT